MAGPHWKSDPRHGTYDAIRTQIVQAAQRLLIAEARPRLQMGEGRRGLRPLSRHELPRALVKPILDVLPLAFEDDEHERRVASRSGCGRSFSFWSGERSSEIDSVDETRGLLRPFVVPSLEWAVGGAQQIARRGSARMTAR